MPNYETGILVQVSGLCYTYDIGRPSLDRLTEVRVQTDKGCDGPVIVDDSKTYTCALVDFLAGGAQGMPVVTSEPKYRTLVLNGGELFALFGCFYLTQLRRNGCQLSDDSAAQLYPCSDPGTRQVPRSHVP